MLETTTGYLNKLFKFTGDANGDPLVNDSGEVTQGSKGPVLFVHSATKDCMSWLNDSVAVADSIPKLLFDDGYDVHLACNRGTAYSRAHETFDLATEAGLADYFNYNTQSVGTEDIEAWVDLILNNTSCSKVQIVTHGLGAGVVMSGLTGMANTLAAKVTTVTNLAPCLVPTYVVSGDSED